MRLANKVACITGGGSGQGKATAILFAREGAKVLVTDVNFEGADEVAGIIRTSGREAEAMRVDVSQEDQVVQMIQKTVDIYGGLDVLFNNAGVGYSSPYVMASIVETPVKDYDAILSINLRGVFLGCKHAIPVMVKQGGGVIINNSSVNALVGVSGGHSLFPLVVLQAKWGKGEVSGVRIQTCIRRSEVFDPP